MKMVEGTSHIEHQSGARDIYAELIDWAQERGYESLGAAVDDLQGEGGGHGWLDGIPTDPINRRGKFF
jgi:hypothetical protein